jgi:hypothetical protein
MRGVDDTPVGPVSNEPKEVEIRDLLVGMAGRGVLSREEEMKDKETENRKYFGCRDGDDILERYMSFSKSLNSHR